MLKIAKGLETDRRYLGLYQVTSLVFPAISVNMARSDNEGELFPFKYLFAKDVLDLHSLGAPTTAQVRAFAREHGINETQVKIKPHFYLFDHPICWHYAYAVLTLPFPQDELVSVCMLTFAEWTAKFPRQSTSDILRCLELNNVPPITVLKFELLQ